MFSIIVELF